MDFKRSETPSGAPNKNQTGVDNVKNILEFEEHRDIHCRTSNARIPAGVPKVFVVNSDYGDIFPEGYNEADGIAIARRHKKFKVPATLYIHKENDRELREQERFGELLSRRIARQALRGVRQAAKDGTLTLGSNPLPPDVQAAMK